VSPILLSYSYYAESELGTHLPATNRSKLDFVGALAIFVVAAILATTIQAQDFQDVEGDKSVGRLTLPIAFPNLSRYTPLVSLMLWSNYLSEIWEMTFPASAAFHCLAFTIGIRYYFWRSTRDDQLSYFLYNVCHLRSSNLFLTSHHSPLL